MIDLDQFKRIFPEYNDVMDDPQQIPLVLASHMVSNARFSGKKLAVLQILEEAMADGDFPDWDVRYKDYTRIRDQYILNEKIISSKYSLLDKLLHPIRYFNIKKSKKEFKKFNFGKFY